MKSFVTAFVTLLTVLTAVFPALADSKQDSAELCNFKFNPRLFSAPLEQFLAKPFFPVVDPLDDKIPTPASSEVTMPKQVADDFYQIQKFIFGNEDTVKLRLCAHCDATTIVQEKSVYIEPKYFEDLKINFPVHWRMIGRFIVAHELSHFIHEAITLRTSNGLSPQNNVPLLRKSENLNWNKMLLEYKSDATMHYIYRSSKSHSEVDGIAIMVLNKMGYDSASAAYNRQPLKSDSSIMGDAEVRAYSIKSAFLEPEANDQHCITADEDQVVRLWTERMKEMFPTK